jgi:multiple sugar transport system permease protein
MPIISTVESRSKRGRLIQAGIIIVLTLGGITMIYPFLIMISGSLRSEMDSADISLVPAFLTNRDDLYRKFLETKYNQDVASLDRAHRRKDYNFEHAFVPKGVVRRRVEDMREFVEDSHFPRQWWVLGGIRGVRTVPENLRELRERLRTMFAADPTALGKALGSPGQSWSLVVMPVPTWLSQQFDFQDNVLYKTYFEMADESPLPQRDIVSITGSFLELRIYPVYGQASTRKYNAAHARAVANYHDFHLPQTVPGADQPQLRKEWIAFVENDLNPAFVALEGAASAHSYRTYLRAHYKAIGELNKAWGTDLSDFDGIGLPDGREWLHGARRQDYLAFLKTQPPEDFRLVGPEYAWQQWLKEKYHSLEAVNAAHQAQYASFSAAALPMAQLEYQYVAEHALSLKWTYATRNFVNVLDELVVQGRAFTNTILFCIFAIGLSLLINPMAAYAMSRFQLPGTYKILLVLMTTMAFPPMVMMIPQFILLRKLGLLNTFIALLLPLAANGYLIFLLKGFFDSLPQELYEAARIDGASEMRMFFQITLNLSKPILAVVALQAFTSAYLMFLYALVVCPDPSMWLISVWLYQFQQRASTGAVYASVLVASIPTLLMFIFAQRTIMRGIVIPMEK